jgi:hypothetical protein
VIEVVVVRGKKVGFAFQCGPILYRAVQGGLEKDKVHNKVHKEERRPSDFG